jgi:hypothetical protein
LRIVLLYLKYYDMLYILYNKLGSNDPVLLITGMHKGRSKSISSGQK